MGKNKYNEIFKLKDMLDKEKINYEFYDRTIKNEDIENIENPYESFGAFGSDIMLNKFLANTEMYQIIIRKSKEELLELEKYNDCEEYEEKTRLVSIIQGYASYGENLDLLEIMGLCENNESVEGYLTAEEVLKRVKNNLK